ncbi:MAG: dienelactone hydrolase family protein [Rhizobacter sp.]|nr:dienelactone hydrolase family protein [Rhizobacter sp.]
MKLLHRLAAALCLCAGTAHAQALVSFPSLDVAQGEPVRLKAHWYPVDASSAPALVLLHGCSGMYGRNGLPSQRMVDYARLLNGQGLHVLMLDSLTPRGEREICTQRLGARRITMANRRLDALAALRWLAQQPQVDARHLGLIGWSNGGSAVLAATNKRHRDVASFPVVPAFAVAFYPGCAADLKRGYVPSAPLLMLVGEADDWTPAAPCHRLARESAAPQPEIEGYAGAFHGFDSAAPLRVRRDVPNGAQPGEGVHVGGDARARAASRTRLLAFLQAYSRSPALPQNTR